jgi:hypothetical protein
MEAPQPSERLQLQLAQWEQMQVCRKVYLAGHSIGLRQNDSTELFFFKLGRMSVFAFLKRPLKKKGLFPSQHFRRTDVLCGWRLTSSLVLVARLATAQDSLRNSMAGDAAAEAQRQQLSSQLYTVKAGDFNLLIVPSMEADWNDNVNLSKTDQESDFILQPLLQLNASYPLTQRNVLNLSVGVGYNDYLRYTSNSSFVITSASQLSFDVFIKDFRINLHDRFSMSDDPSTQPAISGTSQYGMLMNTAGITTTWDLNDLVLTLGYDHQNSLSTFGQFNYLNSSSELPIARAGLHLSSDLTAGVEVTASYLTYEQAVLNNNESYSAGLYADYTPDSYFRVQPRAGYTIYQFQHTSESAQIFDLTPTGVPIIAPTGETIQTQDLNSWYADLTVSHQVTKAINYAFSAGHEVQPGIQSDVVEDYYFRPNINWTIIKDLSLNTSLFYDRGNQGAGNISGNLTETYDWYGGSLMVSYPLMKKLLLTVNYRLTLRSSNIPSDEYAQNLVGLRLTYQMQ